MKLKDTFYPYAFFTSILWSLAYVLTRLCRAYMEPIHIGVIRSTLAMFTLIVVIFVLRLPNPKRKDIKWFLLSGISGIFIYMITFNIGCSTVTTATGTLILAVSPAVTALGARWVFKEKLSALQWVATAISFCGVLLLCMLSGGFSVNSGVIWILCSMVFLSIYNLVQRFLSKSYPPLTITSFSFIVGAIGLGLVAPRAYTEVVHMPTNIIVFLLVLGIGCSALSYCTWTIAFSKAENAASVSNFLFINPFIGTILGAVLVGDSIESSAIIGGGVIMIGIFLFNFGDKFFRVHK